MAWADLPALYIRPVRHGAIPICDPHRVRLGIEDISLEFSHQRALPGGIRLVQHLFVERYLVWIFELRMMTVALHCRLAGKPARAAAFARFVDHILRRDGVWICRRNEIAEHWRRQHPARDSDSQP